MKREKRETRTMLRLTILLPLLLGSIVLLAGNASNLAAAPPHNIQVSTDNETWQDPFYTGPLDNRTWTDVTGTHRVEGRFVELLPERIVRLQRPNGRFVRIHLDELSRADRQLVQEITRK